MNLWKRFCANNISIKTQNYSDKFTKIYFCQNNFASLSQIILTNSQKSIFVRILLTPIVTLTVDLCSKVLTYETPAPISSPLNSFFQEAQEAVGEALQHRRRAGAARLPRPLSLRNYPGRRFNRNFFCLSFGLKNCFKFHFDSETCLNYLFLNIFLV